MKIKIVRHVPTQPSPQVGKEFEVVRIKERSVREGGSIYFVECDGTEVGVLEREMSIVKEASE